MGLVRSDTRLTSGAGLQERHMRKHLGQFWAEFKAFAFKGNMIDLAVAVVIGAAFSGVINSLVKDIIMPGVIYLTTAVHDVGTKAVAAAENTVGATRPAETQPAEEARKEPPKQAAAAAPAPPSEPPKSDPQKPVQLDWKLGPLNIGNFIGELLNFILIALAVFVTIVKLLGSVMKRVGGTPKPSEPTTKECPFCLSVIPIKARKCASCTADLPPVTTTPA
jgi:large conductance mechanosensitive channel